MCWTFQPHLRRLHRIGIGIDIYGGPFSDFGSSKANHLRSFLEKASGRRYEHRAFISGAGELAEVILSFARYHGRDLPETLATSGLDFPTIARSLERTSAEKPSGSSMACLRFLVLGRMEGPPIRVLRYVLGESIFKARALEGSTSCATEIAVSA